MGLTLTVLGSSGSYPGPGAACSGYLLQGGGVTVWLDAGSGTLANLQRHIGLEQVDAIVLSHDHVDHWSDVEGYFTATAYVVPRRAGSVPVYAPREVRTAAARFAEKEASPLDWRDVSDGSEVSIGDLNLRFSQTDHPTETLAVRVDGEGKSLGYSADTGPGWSLSTLGSGLDLALCEATFLTPHEGSYPHMSARQAGLTAREAGAAHLLITHLWPTVDPEVARAEAEAAYDGPVKVAKAGGRYEA
jgi:ribonuclease BN (tRNA processing enzyme)